ncbi:MAG: TolC family protein [Bacteroides sp.]|nr:TolC family protein [Bacteroides sp.]MCM1378825.1 TolC family protein [Bacteroides sp.]MCM1445442.1 TolC family protein [Prevotella sp.]
MKHIIFIIVSLITAIAGRALTIDASGAVELALQNSEELKAADNAVEKARVDRYVAKTAYMPKFAGSATVAWMLPDTEFKQMALTMRARGAYMAGVNLQQPIFAGGKIVAANRMAAIGVDASKEQRRQREIAVKADAETSYWTYVAILAKVEMMKSYAALVDTAMTQTRSAAEAGMAVPNDLLRIEARAAQVKYQHEQVSAGADLCRMALCNSLGLPLDTEITPADTSVVAEVPLDLYNYNLADRPEMRLLEADINVKRQQVRLTRGDFLPTLGLQAGWSAYGNVKINTMAQGSDGNYYPLTQDIKNNGWNIMLSLQVPIFHFLEGAKKVKAARLEVESARLMRDHNERLLDMQVRQAISNVLTGQDLVSSAEKSFAMADAALNATAHSYRAGMVSITALLDAQSQWHTARADLIEARTQLQIHLIDYRASTAAL